MEDNCFINSVVSASLINASSMVMVYSDATVKSTNNFIDAVQTDLPCPFVIETKDYGATSDSYTCLDSIVFDATSCSSNSSYTTAPTAAPVVDAEPTSPSAAPLTPTSSGAPPTSAATTATAVQGPALFLFGVNICALWMVGGWLVLWFV